MSTDTMRRRPFRRQLSSTLWIKPRRHLWRWIWGAAVAVVALSLASAFLLSENMQWDVVAGYLFHPAVMAGLRTTIFLGVIAEIASVLLGAVIALMRLSKNPVLVAIAIWYVWFFRAVPLIVLLIFTFNLGLVFPKLGIGIPFTDIFIGAPTNDLVNGLTAAFIGLAIHEAAYMAEIIRGGIQGVDRGQYEAARSLGLSPRTTMRKVVMPQAMRLIIPPSGNNFIGVLKATSLAAFISGSDLLASVQVIYSRTFEVVPLLLVATFWYLVLVGAASVGQRYIERRFGETSRENVVASPGGEQ